MPTPALLLLIATLLPLCGFGLLLAWGRRLDEPLPGVFSTLISALSFGCTMTAMIFWLSRQEGVTWGAAREPILLTIPFLPSGLSLAVSRLQVGLYIDSLTMAMFAMITLVALLVNVFSIGYMRRDPRFSRFFAYLSLFLFSMLSLVLSATTLQLFICWELVGLCSFLLIGFWHERPSAAAAATKAFVMNRIGDAGFLIAFGLLFVHVGVTSLPELWNMLQPAGTLPSGTSLTLLGGSTISYAILTAIGIGLFLGAVGKSAQFPLHTWLPDAMEGPTPVSALIHAATMVAAGIYLMGRMFPILTPDARLFIVIIGLITLSMAALIAIVQDDIKRVLAWSTISQLGYMVLAIGIGSWTGALFHLLTHAFFKALLFLSAGSIIHAARHEQSMRRLGGLAPRLPVTAACFAIAVLAISGTPFFSGYYSKDMILAHAAAYSLLAESQQGSVMYWLVFYLPAIMAYVTAFYMMRAWMLTFWGRERDPHVTRRAREHGALYVPLLILAVLSIVGGNMLGMTDLLNYARREMNIAARWYDPGTVDLFSSAWPAAPLEHADDNSDASDHLDTSDAAGVTSGSQALIRGESLMHNTVGWAFAIGMAAAFALYIRGYAVTDRLMRFAPLRWIHTWLSNGMYFDTMYNAVFAGGLRGLSILAALFDRAVVDGIVNLAGSATRNLSNAIGWTDRNIVDGAVLATAAATRSASDIIRVSQRGRLRFYVLMALACTIGAFLVLALGAILLQN